ncbi:MAG: tungsten formylmethanofuran dehydrogenase, partial [Bacteroidetes bacterium]
DPVLFLEHKALYRAAAARTPEPDADYLLPFGKANVVREGSDLTIVTYGLMVHKSVNAARVLAREGVSVEVIDIRTMIPLDMDTILASVRKTNRVMVVYEDHEFAGFGAEICAQIAARAFEHLDAPIRRVAGAFTPIPFADPLERAVLPQDEDILAAAREVLAY